jgi:DNA polymerase III delta prime subunit
MGEQGVGKTATAGLLAAALSKQFHGGAPIHVTDPELGWQFLDPVIFQKEGVKLVQYTVPTFAAMLKDLHRAEREGACVWAVELGKIWIEIIRTLQKAKPDNWGMDLRSMWDDFVAQFLNSKLHCLVLGRIQDVIEQILTEGGSVKSIKTGEGMKAGGQRNNFGYEPHLVIRLNLEQKPRVKKGRTFEEEGRMIHRAHVTKDRTWALNGKVFRWPDRDGYDAGDFKYVWQSLAPHFTAVQKTMARVMLDATATSAELVDTDGNSEYYAARQRKEVMCAEIKACMDLFFAGQGKEDKQVRIAVTDLIFGVKSKEAADALTIDQLERGLRILHAYEKMATHDMTSKDTVLIQMHDCIAEYDRGESEEWDTPLPF